jgi:glycyl-tRNA synthetase
MEEIVSLCKRRGFIWAGSEIYGGLRGTWDFGPLGTELKKRLMDLWWQFWVTERDNFYGVDAAILMNPKTWVASGHTETFADPLVEDLETHKCYRADHLLKDNGVDPAGLDFARIDAAIKEHKIKSPDGNALSATRAFGGMLQTSTGVENNVVYLRPETAQGIFTNYKNVLDSFYPDLPFALAQMGKAFRNEISPRDFVFRSREFSQMEIEYFIDGATWEAEFEMLRAEVWRFLIDVAGLPKEMIHELEVSPEDLAHYSKRTIDFEFEYPSIGKQELLGLAYRTGFDLSNVQRESGKSMEYTIKGTNKKILPHVIEPSFGVERLVMAVLSAGYKKVIDKSVDGDGNETTKERVYLALPEHLAPYRFCVSPLLKNKPELVAKAREVFAELKAKYGNVTWDDNGNIGKRYAKQDEIGTPKCVVIDFDTLEDGTVTVRNRDDASQVRVKVGEL